MAMTRITVQEQQNSPLCYEAKFHLPDHEFGLLCKACDGHTRERTHPDITIQTCWDSDRLDLERVGITPHPRRLCTDFAKMRKTIQWADRRAVGDYVPSSPGWDAAANRPSSAWSSRSRPRSSPRSALRRSIWSSAWLRAWANVSLITSLTGRPGVGEAHLPPAFCLSPTLHRRSSL